METKTKIFISWSGDRSKEVAEALHSWILLMFDNADPWVSTRNLDGGVNWFQVLSERLNESEIGIFCLTPENISSNHIANHSWMLYEAGALAKTRSVCPYLLDIESGEIMEPLREFHAITANESETKNLANTLNKSIKLDNALLDKKFETFWPDLEKKLNDIQNRKKIIDDGLSKQVANALGGINVFPDQRETNRYLEDSIKTKKYNNIYMIEYSSNKTQSLIEAAIANPDINVYILLQHPETGKEYSSQEVRIISALQSFYYGEKHIRSCDRIHVLFYKQRASIRGRNLDNKLINLGWYRYLETKEYGQIVNGHKGMTIVIEKDSPHFETAKRYFNETFENLWSSANSVREVCDEYKNSHKEFNDGDFKNWCKLISSEKNERRIILSDERDIIEIN